MAAQVSFFQLCQQALSSVEDGYDLLSPYFDQTSFRTPEPILTALGSYFSKNGPYSTVLDLGCGTGALAETVLPFCQDRLVCLDLSPKMLDRCVAKLLAQAKECELEFALGPVLNLRDQKRYDLIISFGMLGHLELSDHPQLFEIIFQALKPGGKFVTVFSEFSGRSQALRLLAGGFDLFMRMRNAIIKPPFVMYYGNLALAPAERTLSQIGFDLVLLPNLFPEPFEQLKLAVATRP